MAKNTRTNIEVAQYPGCVRKDERGFYVLMGIRAHGSMHTGIRFNIDEEFKVHCYNLYRKGECVEPDEE